MAKSVECVYPTQPGQTIQEALKVKNAELQSELQAVKETLSTLRILPPTQAVGYLNSISEEFADTLSSHHHHESPLSGSEYSPLSYTPVSRELNASRYDSIALTHTVTAAVPNVSILESAFNAFVDGIGTVFYNGRHKLVKQLRAELALSAKSMPKASLAEVCAMSAVGLGCSSGQDRKSVV